MEFQFTVSAEAERVQGKFESRDSIETAIIEWLEAANEGTITGENDGEYEISNWSVDADTKGRSGFTAPKPKITASPDARQLSAIPEVRTALEVLRMVCLEGVEGSKAARLDQRIRAVTNNLGLLVEGR